MRFYAASQKRLKLESILHPKIRQHRDVFIAEQREANAAAILIDVPLLFETGGTLCAIM